MSTVYLLEATNRKTGATVYSTLIVPKKELKSLINAERIRGEVTGIKAWAKTKAEYGSGGTCWGWDVPTFKTTSKLVYSSELHDHPLAREEFRLLMFLGKYHDKYHTLHKRADHLKDYLESHGLIATHPEDNTMAKITDAGTRWLTAKMWWVAPKSRKILESLPLDNFRSAEGTL